jgi:hypothetical protein
VLILARLSANLDDEDLVEEIGLVPLVGLGSALVFVVVVGDEIRVGVVALVATAF